MNKKEIFLTIIVLLITSACARHEQFHGIEWHINKYNKFIKKHPEMADVYQYSIYEPVSAYDDKFYDEGFNFEINQYLNYHLKYPSTGEEFCYNTYRADSLNDFEYLEGCYASYAGIDRLPPDKRNLSYEDYAATLDSIKNLDIIAKAVIPKLTWRYFNRYRSDLVFYRKNQNIYMDNIRDNVTFATDDLLELEKQYMKDPSSIMMEEDEFELRKISDLLDFSVLKFYTSDSIMLFQKMVLIDDKPIFPTIEFQKRITNILAGETQSGNTDASSRTKARQGYILHYNRNGKMTDFFTGNEAPGVFVNNKELTNYLDSLLTVDPRAAFIHFRAYTK